MSQSANTGGDTSADFEAAGAGRTITPALYVLGDAPGPLSHAELQLLDAWWRAAIYLAVGQIYLMDTPLLREPLRPEHVKPRLLGHFGTVPGLNLLYVHANRLIRAHDLDVAYVVGPGHGGPGPNACAWLEGTYSEVYSAVPQDAEGMAVLFPQVSLSGGGAGPFGPETPGSVYERGEVGLLPLPARIPDDELLNVLRGYGYAPHVVSGDDPASVHQAMSAALQTCVKQISEIHRTARTHRDQSRPAWPMIVMRTPKGWTCPPVVDGQQVEGTFRAHQVPLPEARTNDEHRRALEGWLRSYRPQELFDGAGRPVPELLALAPAGGRRMSANPVTNGGSLLRDLRLPDWRDYGVPVERHGATQHEATRVLGGWLRDVTPLDPDDLLTLAPDALVSNRLGDILQVTGRDWQARIGEHDDRLDRRGRVIEVLSEHICQGLLEGYLLTGRHGVFTCYEAFIHIVDSMFNQHAKWLEASAQVPWRRPLASLNYLLSSHVWRQDHNGFTHQDPGFLDVVLNKSPEVVRGYLPPDANTLLSTYDHCLRSRPYGNVLVAGKELQADWLSVEVAALHCARGVGIWEWASSDSGSDTLPDVVLACAGDIPTLEQSGATSILRTELPDLRVRVVNVVDLMRLVPEYEHPHGLTDREYNTLFTEDTPVIFAFHGYPRLGHQLTYHRRNHDQMHVRRYREQGTTAIPFDMVMLNDLDRYHLVMDVIDRVPGLGARTARLRQQMAHARLRARAWTRQYGEDLPEVAQWTWPESQ